MGVPPAVELVWHRAGGAETCIDGRELADRVEATLGRPVSATAAPDDAGPVAVLRGEVTPLGGGWIAVVEARSAGPGGASLRREVTLDGPDCRQLDEAIVLIVALMADVATPQPATAAQPLRLSIPPKGQPLTAAIGVDVTMAIGLLPGFAAGFGLGAEVAFPPLLHLAAWGHYWPTSEALDGGSGARLAAWTFGVGPCLGPTGAVPVAFLACAGASGGVIYASGVGLDVPRARNRPYVQGELRVGFRAHVGGPAFLRLEAGAGVPLVRDTYEFTEPDGAAHEVFRTPVLVPLARLALEFRAP